MDWAVVLAIPSPNAYLPDQSILARVGIGDQRHLLNQSTTLVNKVNKVNRPDIVLKDKKERTCLLIDMSIPTERNTSLKTMEKLKKFKDLEIEIEKTWGLKTTTVPVIIGAFGLVKKETENYIGKIPGNIRITELQKTVLLGTAHILRSTLSIK